MQYSRTYHRIRCYIVSSYSRPHSLWTRRGTRPLQSLPGSSRHGNSRLAGHDTISYLPPATFLSTQFLRSKIEHARNRHLRNHRGFPVAFSGGFPVAFSNGISLFSGMFQRIATCPVDVYCISPMDFQWHFQMEFHFCDFWCAIYVALIPELAHPGVGQAGRGVAVAFVLVANEIGTPDPN